MAVDVGNVTNARQQKSKKLLELLGEGAVIGGHILQQRAMEQQNRGSSGPLRHQQETMEAQRYYRKQEALTDMNRLNFLQHEGTSEENNRYRDALFKTQETIQRQMRSEKARQEIESAKKKHGIRLSPREILRFIQKEALKPRNASRRKDMTGIDKALKNQEKKIRGEMLSPHKTLEQNLETLTEMSKGVILPGGTSISLTQNQQRRIRKEALVKNSHKKNTSLGIRPLDIFKKKIEQKEKNDPIAAEAMQHKAGLSGR